MIFLLLSSSPDTSQKAHVSWLELSKAYTLSAGSGIISFSGKDVTLGSGGRTLTAEGYTSTLTGQAATLLFNRKVEAAKGDFTLTGGAVTLIPPTGYYAYVSWLELSKTFPLTAAGGSISLTGGAVTFDYAATARAYVSWLELQKGYELSALGASFTLTGGAATLTPAQPASYTIPALGGEFILRVAPSLADLVINADFGAIALTGQDATIGGAYTLPIAGGSFVLTGQDVTLDRGGLMDYTMPADPEFFELFGKDAGLKAARQLFPIPALFFEDGKSVELLYQPARRLEVEKGTFSSTGGDAVLTLTPALATYTFYPDRGSFSLSGKVVQFNKATQLIDAAEEENIGLGLLPGNALLVKAGSWMRVTRVQQ